MTVANLVIGASGGIGAAVALTLEREFPDTPLYAVSRNAVAHSGSQSRIQYQQVDANDSSIAAWISQMKSDGVRFRYVVCAAGILHGDVDGHSVFPEKKLEDISADKLETYFSVNSIFPMLWLKHLVTMMEPERAVIALLSARVGSISDNRLGGWYGYRASKAAMNMLVKTAAVEYSRRSKQTRLVCYHPGTVDSSLSEPFQNNVPKEKLFTPAFTADQLVTFMRSAENSDSPYFVDWEHKPVSW